MKKQILQLILSLSICAAAKAQTTYTFIGNGNWSDSTNWQNKQKPPDNLPDSVIINVDPSETGQCIVNVLITLPPTATLNVLAGKKLIVPGNITVKGPEIITDIDGNVYHTVKIGTQTWMVENLKTTHFRDGDAIPNVTDAGNVAAASFYSNYNGDISYVNTYGRLYNWYAVADIRNIVPVGWHIPTDAEWRTLINYLGGESVAGSKMKEIGMAHWTYPNSDATNSSGFTALPGGYRNPSLGAFGLLGSVGYWWSSTEHSNYNTSAWCFRLQAYSANIIRDYADKESHFSIRCVKD